MSRTIENLEEALMKQRTSYSEWICFVAAGLSAAGKTGLGEAR
jgi:hypothetical protein